MREIIAQQGTQKWLDARKGVIITGSRVAPWMEDPNAFSSKQEVLRACIRDELGYQTEFTGNIATQWGTNHEDEAIATYEALEFVKVERKGLCLHDNYDWIGYSPDGVVGDKLIEVKCPYNQKIPEEVPSHYYKQVQLGMAVMDLRVCDFVYWTPKTLKVFLVEREEGWLEKNIDYFKACLELFKDEMDNPEHLNDKFEQIKGADWEAAVIDYRWAKTTYDNAELSLKKAKQRLVELADGKNVIGSGMKVSQVERKGNVQYKKVPELEGVDLEQYRAKSSFYSKVSEEKSQ